MNIQPWKICVLIYLFLTIVATSMSYDADRPCMGGRGREWWEHLIIVHRCYIALAILGGLIYGFLWI